MAIPSSCWKKIFLIYWWLGVHQLKMYVIFFRYKALLQQLQPSNEIYDQIIPNTVTHSHFVVLCLTNVANILHVANSFNILNPILKNMK